MSMLYAIIAGVVILAATLANILPMILGYLSTPQWYTYAGTIHHPGDYFYYLSQFRQGQWSWFAAYDVFSSEFTGATYVGWINVFLGRVFWILGLDAIRAYHVSTVVFTLVLLTVSYLFIHTVLHKKKEARLRIVAFILFVTANAFPQFTIVNGSPQFWFATFWTNYALPFTRLGGVPHHLITHSAIIGILLVAILWNRQKNPTCRYVYLAVLCALGFVVSSINPIQWLVVTSAVGLAGAVVTIVAKQSSPAAFLRALLVGASPSVALFLGGLLPVVYLKSLFAQPPYSQLAAWELAQQIRPTLLSFVLASGPIMLTGLLGVVFMRRITKSYAWTLTSVYMILSVSLFVSPIPSMLGLLDARFISAVSFLCASLLTTLLLTWLTRVARIGKAAAVTLVMSLCILSVIPLWQQLQARSEIDPFNAYIYIPLDVMQSFAYASEHIGRDNIVLVPWPFEGTFPALTGIRVYHGHPLLTINNAEKSEIAVKIFDETIPDDQMQAMLEKEGIDYILTFPGKPSPKPFLKTVHEGGTLILYEVL